MTYEKYDPWQEAANNSGGVDGFHVKFGKGVWTVDNDEVRTGEGGFRLCALMDTAMHGAVKWSNDRTITERRLERYATVAPSRESLEVGWAPYTQFQCVGASGSYDRQLMTFSSSSWGGRYAFHALIRPWLLRGRLEFPVCALGSKPKKKDPNGIVDPLFKIVGWAPRSDFAEMLPPDGESPPTSAATAVGHEARIARATPGNAIEPIDDDIPF
jgi:hypothetical protein